MSPRAFCRGGFAGHVAGIAILLTLPLTGAAQPAEPATEVQEKNGGGETETTGPDPRYLFDHPDGMFWVSGQVNAIGQAHPRFHSPYQGEYSLSADPELAVSLVATVFGGVRLTPTTEVLLDIEAAGGGGLSDALGLGGFTNLDVVRNPALSSAPYLARAVLHQVIPLSHDKVAVERGPLRTFSRLPAHRLEVRAGKFGTADLFDLNGVGSDSHLQFMNWAICNNAAYDYAADTRGYTLGAVVEYQGPRVGARFGEMLMPTVANGQTYDTDLAHARGENLELELRHALLGGREGVVRALGFLNHARMGDYREANASIAIGPPGPPKITEHRKRGAIKAGFGLNAQQELLEDLRAFLRVGWNDGRNESFAYTEVDDTVSFGADLSGARWSRPYDKLGVALASNGLLAPHRNYLALGGQGFLLGDGRLNYGRELIVEAYYTFLVYRGVAPAVDVQVVENPGFNRDRGPVFIASLRAHVEL